MKEQFNGQVLLSLWKETNINEVNFETLKKIKDLPDKVPELKQLTKLEEEFKSKVEELDNNYFDKEGKHLIDILPDDFTLVDYDSLFSEQVQTITEDQRDKASQIDNTYKLAKANLLLTSNRDEALTVLFALNIIDKKLKVKKMF